MFKSLLIIVSLMATAQSAFAEPRLIWTCWLTHFSESGATLEQNIKSIVIEFGETEQYFNELNRNKLEIQIGGVKAHLMLRHYGPELQSQVKLERYDSLIEFSSDSTAKLELTTPERSKIQLVCADEG